MGTVIEPVPVTGLAANFSPMPRIAPPPLGKEIDGAENCEPLAVKPPLLSVLSQRLCPLMFFMPYIVLAISVIGIRIQVWQQVADGIYSTTFHTPNEKVAELSSILLPARISLGQHEVL
jgi:hypothetical protein